MKVISTWHSILIFFFLMHFFCYPIQLAIYSMHFYNHLCLMHILLHLQLSAATTTTTSSNMPWKILSSRHIPHIQKSNIHTINRLIYVDVNVDIFHSNAKSHFSLGLWGPRENSLHNCLPCGHGYVIIILLQDEKKLEEK